MNYNLDDTDKRILFELDRNARIPDTQIAKIIRKSKESARYRIKKLQEEKIIRGFSIWIDPSKIGFMSGKIYLNLANRPEQRKALIEYVKRDNRLLWLGLAEGAWNIGLTFFIKSNQEFYELKNELFSKFREIILDSQTASLVEIQLGNKNFLHPSKDEWKKMFQTPEKYDISELEKNILNELFQNSRINIVDIAHKYKSTVDIIRNRIKRMDEKGIIAKYTIQIDYTNLGYEFYKTFLYFKNFSKNEENRLVSYAKNNPNIINIIKQISPWDIELEIMCKSYHEYNQIIDNLTKEFANIIQKVQTAIMTEDHVFPAKQMVFE